MTEQYVLDLREIDEKDIAIAGGKGANLGALSRIEGVTVPAGFVVTTAAFRRDTAEVAAAITEAVTRLGERDAYAVRSSATAEDLPTASFAGQQDTYLNVVGPAAVVEHVRRCWESLFTERAVAYRRRHGIDDRSVSMAVVVQRMVVPAAAGVLFTADPVSGHRRVSAVEAVPGLGDALVSGLVNPDAFRVRDDVIVEKTLVGERPTLTDEQVVRLARLGRRIEARFGRPQDIEWCLAGDGFAIVQSRPITTLFPVPEAGDQERHIYLSVGHQQMMTDAMRPLGLSLWKLTAMATMHDAGGRLFVDVAPRVSTPAGRAGMLELIGRSDPLFRDALETVLADIPLDPDPDPAPAARPAGPAPEPIPTDPAIVADLIRRSEESIAALRRDIAGTAGPARFDFLLRAFEEHKRMLGEPLSIQAIMAGMEATWWLNEHLREWLGEKNAADTLTLSAPHNVTSEMGLALLDVADAIRPYPEVVAALQRGELDRLAGLPGGAQARDAIQGYLDAYGMRCVGEIDITRPRWSEQPGTLVPVILDNVRNFAPGARQRRFEEGRRRAEEAAADFLRRLRALPDGERKADETRRMIDRVRTFIGYREYPKFAIISRYFVYKQALMAEADALVAAGVLADREDIFFLTFAELHDVVRTHRVDERLIRQRRAEFRSDQALTPPRVLTSDGECVNGSYHRDDAPPGALLGLPVSAGTVEGRARVILDLADADLAPGDILVTAYTDPSWSPLFVAIEGLITEVGGLMTHGAVVAREYGLPAVVGVPNATRTIRDGQRIRLHGTDGYIEILS